jgi:hypothetical protein
VEEGQYLLLCSRTSSRRCGVCQRYELYTKNFASVPMVAVATPLAWKERLLAERQNRTKDRDTPDPKEAHI